MNKIPSPQEACIENGRIVDYEIFWWPISELEDAPYLNNFFSIFEECWSMNEFKTFLDIDASNFSSNQIEKYVLDLFPKVNWEERGMTQERFNGYTSKFKSFAEYYRAFPERVGELVTLSSKHDKLGDNISEYVRWKVHSLTNEYTRDLYHAYAYMRTEPWTSDAILTS